jgi:hypothetical protein
MRRPVEAPAPELKAAMEGPEPKLAFQALEPQAELAR